MWAYLAVGSVLGFLVGQLKPETVYLGIVVGVAVGYGAHVWRWRRLKRTSQHLDA